MKKLFLALALGLCLTGCQALEVYQGVFQSDNGVELMVLNDSIEIKGLSQFGLKDQYMKIGNLPQGFMDNYNNIYNGKTGLYIFPARESVLDLKGEMLFGARQSEDIEKAAGYTLSDSRVEVYAVTEISMSEQSDMHKLHDIKEGSSTVLAFIADKKNDKQVQEFDAVLGVDVDTGAINMPNVSQHFKNVIVLNPLEQIKLHFKRIQ